MSVYAVVGCGECHALWIREGEAETARCPRCGTRHRVDSLRRLAEREDVEAAREARSELLAKRRPDEEVAGYVESETPLEASAIPDETFLSAQGIDSEAVADAGSTSPTRRDARERVLALIDEVDDATMDRLVAAGGEYDLEPDRTRRLVERLHRDGYLARDESGYRLIDR